ncbi:MAG TPA: apolipoprotein N-acyltransferase, partial [Acidobacteriota bacterium]
QDQKINYNFAEQVHRKHLRLTSELIQEAKPDLILWSEASALFSIPIGGEWTKEITDLARTHHMPLVVGSDSYTAKQVFNTAYFINANGEIESEYSKMYLVPFGEFVPLSSLFFFAGKVVPEISDFSPGARHTLFRMNGNSFAIHICFEVVFPQLTRTFCRKGATLLATITNDAWFGDTAAPHQHFAMVVMRAIESRRYMVRAANTGISGIVDPYGRILHQSSLFVPAKIAGDVQWIHEQTFYTLWGDVLVYLSIIVSVLAIARAMMKVREP